MRLEAIHAESYVGMGDDGAFRYRLGNLSRYGWHGLEKLGDGSQIGIGDGVSAKYTSTDTLLYAGSDQLGTIVNAKLIETEDGVWGEASLPLA